MKSPFKTNLIFTFGLSLLLLIIASAASYFSIRNLLDSQRWVNHTNQVIFKLENLISTITDAEASQRSFLLTGQNEFLQPYNSLSGNAFRTIDEIKTLTSDNIAQKEPIDRMRLLVTDRFKQLQLLIDIKKAERIHPLMTSGKEKPIWIR